MYLFRKLIFSFVSFLLITALVLSGCGSKDSAGGSDSSDEKVLNVFNWSDYFSDSVIKKFEEETGIKVNYSTFSSNEEMYAKLSTGNSNYDVTVVTTNFIELLIKEDLVEKINEDNIPNLKNIGEEFSGNYADPNDEYSVPYLWGFYPIAVNEEITEMNVEGIEDLFDPSFENNLAIMDDPRPVIGSALQVLGYSPNTTNEEEIREAGELLQKLKPNIKAVDTESKNFLMSKEAKAVITYSGDAYIAKRENPNIKIIFPKEGILTWQEGLVIPKNAPHKENAEKFIDFINRPEIMKELLLEYPYGTSNVEAAKLLPEEVRKETQFVEEFKQGELLKDVGEATQLYDRVWTEFRQ